MSWADEKPREVVPDVSLGHDYSGMKVRRLIERAIRETIEKCAEVADEEAAITECDPFFAGRVIRKLGEP